MLRAALPRPAQPFGNPLRFVQLLERSQERVVERGFHGGGRRPGAFGRQQIKRRGTQIKPALAEIDLPQRGAVILKRLGGVLVDGREHAAHDVVPPAAGISEPPASGP